jgi:ureidoglycolate lyase
MRTLIVQPLSATHFAPYGDVLGGPLQSGIFINGGTSERIALGDPDLDRSEGHASLNLYRARANCLPFLITEMERHCLGSQSFIPLKGVPFVVVVALGDPMQHSTDSRGNSLPGAVPLEHTLAAFWVDGSCGVNFRPGIWHHPLLAQQDGDFVVLERKAHTVDCEIRTLIQPVQLVRLPPHADQ